VLITGARPVYGTVKHPKADATSYAQIAAGMADYWRQLIAHGIKVIAIRETPENTQNIPDCLSAPGATVAPAPLPRPRRSSRIRRWYAPRP